MSQEPTTTRAAIVPAGLAILLAALCAVTPTHGADDWLLDALVDVLDTTAAADEAYAPLGKPAGPANAAPAFVRVSAPRLTEPPVIDGKLEPTWRDAVVARLHGGATPTWAHIATDDDHLYAAFVCHEPAMATLLDNAAILGQEAVHLLLDVNGDGGGYLHVTVLASGEKRGPRSKWDAKINRAAGYWTAEIQIPFASLNVGLDTTDRWGIELARERATDRLRTRAMADPALLGKLGHLDDFSCATGNARLSGKADGWEAKVKPRRRVYMAKDFAELRLRYDWAKYAAPDFDRRHEAGVQGLTKLDQAFRPLADEHPSVAKLFTRVAAMRSGWDELKKRLSDAEQDAAQRPAFAAEVRRLEEVVRGVRDLRPEYVQRMGEIFADSDPAFAVAVIDSTRKAHQYKDTNQHLPMWGFVRKQARLALAKNEDEGLQVLVIPLWEALNDVQVLVTDLEGPGAARIDAGNMKIHPVGYTFTKYFGDAWVPDILLDNEPFRVEGHIQPVWVSLHVPPETEAGVYAGDIRVSANGTTYAIKLTVEVYDFALPRQCTFRIVGHLNLGSLDTYHPASHTRLNRLAYYDTIVKRRVNPVGLYSDQPEPPLEYLPFCMTRGQNAITLAGFKATASESPGRKQYYESVRARGWEDNLLLYISDEMGNSAAAHGAIQNTAQAFRALYPGVKTCGAATAPYPGLVGAIDVWIPFFGIFGGSYFDGENRARCQERIAAGDDVWGYVCCDPRPPWPNLMIAGHAGITPRIIPWMFWREGLSGFLYYYINNWMGEDQPGGINVPVESLTARNGPFLAWNTYALNGDGMLIYPGPHSSTRLENLRDGVEDYEYLAMLRRLIDGKREKLSEALRAQAEQCLVIEEAIIPKLVANPRVCRYTEDVADLYRKREQIARMIEKLQALP